MMNMKCFELYFRFKFKNSQNFPMLHFVINPKDFLRIGCSFQIYQKKIYKGHLKKENRFNLILFIMSLYSRLFRMYVY